MKCNWSYIDFSDDCYRGNCLGSHAYIMTNNIPEHSGFKYCPNCRKEIQVVYTQNDSSAKIRGQVERGEINPRTFEVIKK